MHVASSEASTGFGVAAGAKRPIQFDRLNPGKPCCAIGTISTGYLAWRLWLRAVSLHAAGETTAQLKFKLAYLTYAMAILMALLFNRLKFSRGRNKETSPLSFL